MESAQQSSLLSLNGGIENLLLSYVSSGDGGSSAILNLRQVCSTTKSWIDDLPLLQAKQTFRQCQATVNLHQVDVIQINKKGSKTKYKNPFDTIRKFMKNPPPAFVNTLRLSGVKYFAATRSSPEEDKLWRRFALFWWERLESLEVDYVDKLLRPMESRVNQLLSAPSLRRLLCSELEEQMDPLELPQGLFCVEHLSIHKLKLSAIWTTQFFEYLGSTPKLNSFKISISEIEKIEEIANFLVLTKDKVNLEVTFTFDYSDKRSPGPANRRQDSTPTPEQLPPSFVSAVAASAASIRILKLDGKQLKNLKEIVGEATAKKFFETVENITEFETTGPEHNDLLDFPNLQRLGLLKNSMSHADNNKLLFPPNLQELSVQFGFPEELPQSLTSLTIHVHRSSVAELLESFVQLDNRCPLLKSFELEWNGDNNFQVSCACCINGMISNHQDLQSTKIPFRNLKRLRFSLDALPRNSHPLPTAHASQQNARVSANVNGACWILLNGFKLPHLSLLELDLDFYNSIPRRNALLPELDRSAMISLIRGPIAESLVRVKIDESFVAQNALLLKKTLELMAEENALKLRSVVGSKKYTRSRNSEP